MKSIKFVFPYITSLIHEYFNNLPSSRPRSGSKVPLKGLLVCWDVFTRLLLQWRERSFDPFVLGRGCLSVTKTVLGVVLLRTMDTSTLHRWLDKRRQEEGGRVWEWLTPRTGDGEHLRFTTRLRRDVPQTHCARDERRLPYVIRYISFCYIKSLN